MGVGIQIQASPTAGSLLLPPSPAEYQENGRNSPFLFVHRTIATRARTSISGRWRLRRALILSGARHGWGKPEVKPVFFVWFFLEKVTYR